MVVQLLIFGVRLLLVVSGSFIFLSLEFRGASSWWDRKAPLVVHHHTHPRVASLNKKKTLQVFGDDDDGKHVAVVMVAVSTTTTTTTYSAGCDAFLYARPRTTSTRDEQLVCFPIATLARSVLFLKILLLVPTTTFIAAIPRLYH